VGLEAATLRLAVEYLNHSAASRPLLSLHVNYVYHVAVCSGCL